MTRNKKIVISVISAIVAIIVLFSVITANINATAAKKLFQETGVQVTQIDFEADYGTDSTQNLSKKNNAGKGYKKVAETASLELYYKQDRFREAGGKETDVARYDIAVYDKKAKQLWKALPDDKNIDYENAVDSLLAEMQSLVRFEYFDIGKDNNKTFATSVMNELVNDSFAGEQEVDAEDIDLDALFGEGTSDGELGEEIEEEIEEEETGTTNVTLSDIPNGIRFSYDISSLSLKFAIDFKISGDKFDVVVPVELIEDELENYSALKDDRNAMSSKISTFSNQFSETINDLDATKALDAESTTRLERNLRNVQDRLRSLSDMVKTGGDASRNLEEVRSAMSDLENMFNSFGGFEGVLNDIYVQFEEIVTGVQELSLSSLCGLVSLTPLPYFGGATNKEEGYVFYPDGSGALSYFNVKHPEYASAFRKDVYSNYISDIATYLNWIDEEDTSIHEEYTTVAMPVFGIKKANAAFVSIIAEGDSDASISYTPYSDSIRYNSISAGFYMRKTTQNTSSVGDVSQIIDPDLIQQARRLRYIFLAGDDADYAGMAVKYREHLDTYGLIKQSKYMESTDIPLFLELFMGYKTTGTSVMPVYRGTTTFTEAQNILTDLKTRGVGSINTSLMGWSQAGFYDNLPDYSLKPDGEIGGKDDLKTFAEYANNNGINLSLENQFTFAKDDDISYNDKDIGTTKNYGGFTIEAWRRYMFNPTAVFNKVLDAAETYKGYNVNGATLKYEGSILYNDYNANMKQTVTDENGKTKTESVVCNRNLTMATMQMLGTKVKEQLGYVNYRNPRMYMASVADWFADAPMGDTEMLIGDGGVPFMQIVLHGYIPYTCGFLNNMYDIAEQRLKYIEYGVMPSYVITGKTPDSRENTTDFLFSTNYSDWADEIEATYKEYKENFNDTWKAKITDHETLKNGLVCVTYENGVKIVLNYSKKALNYNNVKVAAQDYAVIR